MLEFLKRRFFGTKKTSRRSQPIRLTLEEFETRYLPNAGPLFAGIHQLGFGDPAHVGSGTAGSADPSGSCQGQGQTQTLAATLTGATGTTGSITFSANATAGTNNLTVKVSGLTADTTYTVTSGSTTLGTITTNANGVGQLTVSNVSSAISSALTAGATITVVDPLSATILSGTLAASSTTTGTSTHLSASLSSPSGTTGITGTANFDANSISGQSSLSVRVSGLTPDATYTVQVGGTTVDQIYTDAYGNAWLAVSNVPTSVTSGSTIAVLDSTGATVLSGTFATDTGYVGSTGHHR